MSASVKTIMDAMSEQARAAAATKTVQIEFDEAFTLYHRTVFRCARSVVQDSALAEDIVQETFLRLYKNLDGINDLEMLRPWLIRVALNLSKNAVRGNVRANVREEYYFKQIEENSIFAPEVDYEKREQAREVQRALQKIKEPLRSCLMLKQQGLSYREIADTLSLNETSIGTFVARARKEFARFYGQAGSEKFND